jgi:hypothetical protein
MAQGEKNCIYCGQDCSAMPRVKDSQGRYACKACIEKQGRNRADPEPISEEPMGNDDFGLEDVSSDAGLNMDEFLSDVEVPESSACPECGSPKPGAAAVCMNCGHNAATGETASTKIKTPSKAGALAGAAAAQAGGAVATPLFGILGGIVAGVIGAGLWGGLSYFTGFEFGILAWGIGLIVGIGVAVGARGRGSVLTGFLAMLIAILSIAGGKYFAAKMMLENVSGQEFFDSRDIDREAILQIVVDELAMDRLDNGEDIPWPTPGTSIDTAIWPDDYPQDLQTEAIAVFDGLTFGHKVEYQTQVIAQMNANLAANADAIIAENFWYLWSFWDAIWVILAISTAYKVGSGEAGD